MLNPPLPHPTPPFSGMNAVHEVSEGMPFCRLTLYIDLHSGVSVRFRITLGQNRTAGDSDVVFLQKTPPPPKGLGPSLAYHSIVVLCPLAWLRDRPPHRDVVSHDRPWEHLPMEL